MLHAADEESAHAVSVNVSLDFLVLDVSWTSVKQRLVVDMVTVRMATASACLASMATTARSATVVRSDVPATVNAFTEDATATLRGWERIVLFLQCVRSDARIVVCVSVVTVSANQDSRVQPVRWTRPAVPRRCPSTVLFSLWPLVVVVEEEEHLDAAPTAPITASVCTENVSVIHCGVIDFVISFSHQNVRLEKHLILLLFALAVASALRRVNVAAMLVSVALIVLFLKNVMMIVTVTVSALMVDVFVIQDFLPSTVKSLNHAQAIPLSAVIVAFALMACVSVSQALVVLIVLPSLLVLIFVLRMIRP